MISVFTSHQSLLINNYLLVSKRFIRLFFCLFSVLLLTGQALYAQTVTVSNSDPSCLNSPITFTATINPSTSIGTVQFKDGGVNIGPAVSVSGGVATLPDFVLSTVGSHSITADYSDGISSFTSAGLDLTINALPTANITGTSAICAGTNTVLASNATAGSGFISAYQWNLNGTPIIGATSATYTAITAGDYTVTVTNSNGCSFTSAAFVVTVNALPTATITAGGPTVFCTGGSVTLTASSGASWLWSNGATTQAITVNASGSYSVTVTDGNGCSATSVPTAVTVNPLPTATITAGGPTTFCFGGSVTLTASVGSSWLWSNGATTQTITVNASGSYSVTVTDGNACSATSAPTTVTVNPLPTAIITAGGPTTFCTGGSVTLTASAGASWLWSNGATTQAITVNTSGSYSVTVTDGNGCSATSAATVVTVNPFPTATITAGGPTTICIGGSVTLTASAGASWLWSNGATTQSTTVNTSGSYSVTITNGNGCSATSAAIAVTINARPVPTINGSATVCAGSTGNVYTTEAGMSNYVWTVNGGTITSGGTSTSNTANVTWTAGSPRSISVNYTDANGCNATTPTVYPITVNPLPIITPAALTSVCFNAAAQNAILTYTATNTPTIYSIGWNAAATSAGFLPIIDAALPGSPITIAVPAGAATGVAYTGTISVKNANGCTSSGVNFNIVVNPLPVAFNVTGGGVYCSGGTGAPVTLNGSQTGVNYQLRIGGVNTGSPVPGTGSGISFGNQTAVGTYTVVAINNTSACSALMTGSVNVTIDIPSVGGTTAPALQTVCQNANAGALTLSGYTGTIIRWESSTNGGVPPWTPIANTSNSQTYTNLSQTTLYRAVIQSGTCPVAYSTNAVVSVIPPQTPIATANPTAICVGQSSVLTSSSGLPTGTSGVDGSFNGANPPGWCVDGQCTGSFLSANGDNTAFGGWRETNSHAFNGIFYTSPNPKFAIANGIFTSTLETPVFSLIGQSPASLDFIQSYILTAGSSATIEISTNGGASYSAVLAQYTGPSTFGISGTTSTMQSTSIPLANYIGLSNLKIRFTYSGNSNNSAWVIDGIAFPGAVAPVNYTWSASDGSTITGQSATVSPTTTTTYTLSAIMNGCVLGSTNVTVTVFQLPVVSTVNSCIGGGPVTFIQTGGAAAGTWTVSGGGSINSGTGVFTPTTAGCFTATYRTTGPGCTDTKNFVVFPAVPTLGAPTNTCVSAFTLPIVPAVSGFNVQFSIDGSGFSPSPTIPTTPGCHTISARYVLASACGGTAAGTPATCGPSNTVNVVIFPSAPLITAPGNACASAFSLPAVPAVSGFNIEYSIDGGVFTASPSTAIPGCHTIRARYVLAAACGSTPAGTAGTGTCGSSNTVNVVIFPSVPVLSAPVNTCASSFALPGVPAVSGFNIEYSIDGGAFSTSPSIITPGCHTVVARYVLATTCGSTPAGTQGTGACGTSNTVNVVIFPAAPVIAAPANTCASSFALPGVASVSGFNIEYSVDGGAFSTSPSTTTPGCHTITARYVLAAACGSTTAGTAGTGVCSQSNTVSTVIFPAAPTAPTVSTGCGPIVVTAPASISGFNIEYSFDDGAIWGANNPPTADNCAGYKIKTRYVLATNCGSTLAGAPSTIVGCGESPATTRIVDNTPPSITCPPAQIFCEVTGNSYTIPFLSAAPDNCGGALNMSFQITGATTRSDTPGNNASGVFNPGVSTITWTVTDACGNTSTCSTTVTVNKKPNPIITHN